MVRYTDLKVLNHNQPDYADYQRQTKTFKKKKKKSIYEKLKPQNPF